MLSLIISCCLFAASLPDGDVSLMIAAGLFNVAGQISTFANRYFNNEMRK